MRDTLSKPRPPKQAHRAQHRYVGSLVIRMAILVVFVLLGIALVLAVPLVAGQLNGTKTTHSSPKPRVTVTAHATVTKTPAANRENLSGVRVGRALKPLTHSKFGDKVILWREGRKTEVCAWQAWDLRLGLSTQWSVVMCEKDVFSVPTQWLVPGEWYHGKAKAAQ